MEQEQEKEKAPALTGPWWASYKLWAVVAGVLLALLVITQFFSLQIVQKGDSDVVADAAEEKSVGLSAKETATLQESVVPKDGVVIPITWNDFGKQMVDAGVIDEAAFTALYDQRGGLTAEEQRLLTGTGNGSMRITLDNAGTILNLLWAFGLANKNTILENGQMTDPQYGGADRFASTGGWTLAKGNVMEHFSAQTIVTLTAAQQALVEKVSGGIYRPCCGNATNFPDCNHGMAMLGLLEIMAAQGASEKQMWDTALAVNAYWFPDTYVTLAKYFNERGTSWDKVDAQTVLGSSYSSATGYRQILAEVEPEKVKGGGSCGV